MGEALFSEFLVGGLIRFGVIGGVGITATRAYFTLLGLRVPLFRRTPFREPGFFLLEGCSPLIFPFFFKGGPGGLNFKAGVIGG